MTNLTKITALTSFVLAAMVGSTAMAQNPIVGSTASSSISYDPFNDHTYIENNRTNVRQSFNDANRNRVDPGSFKYVDRYFQDNRGRMIHEFGPTWTTFGKPHGNLTRETVTTIYPTIGCPNTGYFPGGGTTIHDQDTVLYSQRFPNQGRPQAGGVTQKDSGTVLYSQQFPNSKRPLRGGTTIKDQKNVIFSLKTPNKGGVVKKNKHMIQFRSFRNRR